MKKEIPFAAIAGIGAVVAAVLGYFIYRGATADAVSKVDPKTTRNRMMERQNQQGAQYQQGRQQGGQGAQSRMMQQGGQGSQYQQQPQQR